MSVIVKGMKFPKNCLECDLRRYDANAEEEYCPFTDIVCLNIGRQNACLLGEVKDPHGDLIDRNQLVLPSEDIGSRFAVEYAPTVIEAEEGVEE